jgi:hypothetical protein
MSYPRLKIEHWRFWTPESSDPTGWLEHWRKANPLPESTVAPAAHVPAMQRRRMSRLSRMALEVATTIPGGDAADFVVFCSQHGEIQRTTAMLIDMAAGIEPSPTAFSMSVHNTSAGLFSILLATQTPSTSIGAGAMSFVAGWIEAAAWLSAHPDHSVLLVAFDEAVPEPYRPYVEQVQCDYAVALLLSADQRGLAIEQVASGDPWPWPLAPSFLAWWQSAEPAMTFSAERQGWRWRRHA